ncbi:hypothetical protein YC2023_066299 [Brassica napus]
MSVCICVCPSAHTGRPWLSISTRISTLVLGLRTLNLPVYCSGDFGPRGLSGQYTQDVRGCLPAHTGCLWLSVCVRLCPSTHRGRLWLSISTHISTLVLGLSTLALPVDCLGDFGPRGLSVQYKQRVCGTSVAVHGCLSALTGRLCVSVGTHRTSVCVRVSPSAHTGRPWLYISTHISTPVLGLSTLALPVDCSGNFGPRGLSVQYTQDVCGCPSAHTGRPWVSVSTHRTSVAVRVCPCVSVHVRQHTYDVRGCPSVHISARWPFPWTVRVILADVGCLFSTHKTSVGVRQHTQDVRGCPSVHISERCTHSLWVSASTHRTSVAVCGCPSAHTGRLWLSVCVCICLWDVRVCPCESVSTHRTSVAVHQYTYQHAVLCLSTLALPVDCSGDFGPRGRLFSTHMTSVGVHQHTQDVCGCPSAHTGRLWLSVCVRVCPCVSVSTHMTSVAVHHTHRMSVGVRQHTQDVHGCPSARTGRSWLSVCVRVCPSAHTGCPWLSIIHTGRPWVSASTHRTSVAVCVCPSVSVSTQRTSVAVHQYTYQHVVHTGHPWVSASTHMTSVAVRQHTQDVRDFPTLTLPMDCSGDFGPRGLSVQYTHDVCGCPSAHTGRPCVFISTHRTSGAVRVCMYVSVRHTGRSWLSISAHISTLVHGLSTLTLPVDCLGDFGPRGLSGQYTQDGCGCPPAHTAHPWLSVCVHVCSSVSVSKHMTSVAVHQYTYQHVVPTGRPWESASTHSTSVAVRQHTQDVRVCLWVSASTHRTFVAVCGCPSAHTRRPCVSVSTHRTSVCVHVCHSAHTGRLWLSISTHISTLVLGLSTLFIPLDCLGDFGPPGLSVRYTHDVWGCPSAHTGRPCVSVSTHKTSGAVRVCPLAHTGRTWLSISTHINTLVLGLSTLTLPADCSDDFGPRGLCSVHTGRPWVSASTHSTSVAVCVRPCVSVCVRGCPSVHISALHTGRPWGSASTHRTSVGVRQYTYQHVGSWTQHADPSRGLFGTSVCVRKHTQDVRVCPSAHTGRSGLSVCVCVCPSAHIGGLWLSISTHISTLVLGLSTLILGLSTLTLPVNCSGDFGPCGLSGQYTQDVRGCPPAHTGHPWLSVCVHVCSSVSVSTHRTYVAVHQYTYQHVVHTGRPWVSASAYSTSVAVCGCPSAHTRRLWLSVCDRVCLWVSASTHRTFVAVRGCPSAHIGRPCVSVSTHRTSMWVHVCPSAHTGRLWLSISTHISTLALAVDYLGDFGPRGLSVQYTQEIGGCPPEHTGRPWVSDSTYISTLVLGLSTLTLPVDCSGDFGPRELSVQYTQDVRGCPSAHTGRPCVSVSTHRTSVCVRRLTQDVCGCPSVHISACCTHRTSVGVCQHTQDIRGCPTHISTLVLGLSTLTLPMDCSGDFGPRGLSVQYTHDVCGCPSAHTGRPCVFISTHRTSGAVRVCMYVSVRHTGRSWLSISAHISKLVLGLSTLTLPVDCLGDFGPRGLSGQYTQDGCGCPPAHTAHPTHISMLVLGLRMLALPVDCLGDFGPRGLSVQYPQDVRGSPPAHTARLWLSVSTHRTSVAILVCLWVSASTHRTFVAVCGCLSAHTGRPCVSVSTHRTSVCVHVCHSAHTGRPWLSISTHISTLVLGLSTLSIPLDWLDDFGPHGLSVQYTQDVRGGLSAHTGCLWVSVIHVGRPWVSVSTHRTSVCVLQHTQDVRVCPSAHTGRSGLSVCVCVCPSAHTGGLWLSISTHISTLVLGLSTLTLPVNCSGDFGPRGLSGQYTQDVRGCPPAHTGHPWLSVCVHVCSSVSVSTHRTYVAVHHTHRTSVGVRQRIQHVCGCLWLSHTQDVRSCPWLSVSTHRTSVWVHVCPSAHIGRLWLSISTHISTLALAVDYLGDFGPRGLSVQYTQDIRGCPPEHTGRPWVSDSTHISTLVLGLSTLTLPVDCSGDFGPRELSVQYTQDVRGCPSAHTGRPCVSVSTHRTSVCVRRHTQDVCGLHTGRSWVSVSTHRTSVCVRQHTQDIRVCPSAHTGRLWLSISTHISMLVLGLSTLTLPVNCSGDFGPRGLSVQYTQDIRGCLPAHTGRPWLSVSTHRMSVTFRVCPCVFVSTHKTSGAVRVCMYVSVRHTGRSWLSISAHISKLVLGLSTLTLPVDCLGDFGPRGLSGQYTQDGCGCPPAHTAHPTHISMLVLGLSMLALPVDCLGDFGPRGLSVQYPQDVRGSPPAHTARLWLSVSTHRTSVAILVCLWVSASTHRTFVAVCGCLSAHTGRPCVSVSTHRTSVCVHVCNSAHTGRPWLSISTHISTLVLGLSTLSIPLDWLDDFGPHGLSVQYTQDVRGGPPAHTGCLWVSVSTHISTTRRTSVGVRQHTQDVRVCPSAHTGRPCVSISTHRTFGAVRVCLCVSVSTHRRSVAVHHTHRTSVGVRQHIQDIRGCPCVSMCVRLCPSAHIGHTWLSISTHISMLVLGLSTLTLPVDCLGDFGPRGVSVQYTQDVRGCPPAHTARLWLSVAHTQDVRSCPWLSVSTHRTSVWVHVCPSAHIGRLWLSISTHISTLALAVDYLGDFGPRGLSVQYTQDIRGCPPEHTGRPWVSDSTHISTLVLGLSTLTLPVDCSGDFGPRELSVQYTQDVRGCLSAHTGRPCVSVSTHRTSVCVRRHTQDVCGLHTGRSWVSVSTHRTSVCVRQHTQDIRVCPSAHTGRLWLSISTHISMLVLGLSTLTLPVNCSGDFGPRGLSVQYTQDIRGCLPAHTGRPWLFVSTHRMSVTFRVCPCVFVSTHKTSGAVRVCMYVSVRHTGRSWLSISAHISKLVLGLSTLTLPVDCLGDFGPRGLSGQYTQDGCGCPPAHTAHPTHISMLVLGLSMLALPVDCLGDFGPRGLSVQYPQDVRGSPPAHTARLWLSVSTHRTSVAILVCLWVSVSTHRTFVAVCGCLSAHTGRPCVSVSTHRTSVCVHVCHSAHTGRPWLSISTHISTLVLGLSTLSIPLDWTSVGVRQYTYQHVGSWTQHADPSRGLFGTSVCVRQHTQDVRVCPSAHTGRSGLSVCVCVCPSAHTGGLWLSISTHISTLVLGLSTLTLPVNSSGDFGPRGLSGQYTQDVRGCPPAHTGHPWLSVCVHVCSSVSVSTHRTYVAVHQYTYQHVGPWTQHADPSRGLFGTSVAVRQHTQDVRDFPCVSVCVRQHTQDICGCPSVHISAHCTHMTSVGVRQHTQDVRVCSSARTGRPGLSVFVCMCLSDTQDVRGCPSVHISASCTHRTAVGVRQHTQHIRGCPCVSMCVRLCPSANTGRPWLSISTHISMLVLGLSMLALPVDCLGDFGPRGLSVEYPQDVRGSPPAHTARLWLSVSTHRTSVAILVCLWVSDVRGCPLVHISARWSLDSARCPFLWTGWVILAHLGCLFGTHMTSGGVRQHTQDVRVCPSAHTGHLGLSVCVRVCPSAHTGCTWLSISTHINTLVLGVSTLTLPADCSDDFGPRGLCVQYTQDVRGCLPAHTVLPWLSVCVCVCPSVSVSTQRTSVAVHQYTYQHYTQDVRGGPPAHTGRLWVSASTHISTLVLGLSTLALPVDCLGDLGPRGLSVQYTQDIRGCPPVHTARLWLTVAVRHSWLSVSTHRMSVTFRVCPCVSVSTHMTSVGVRQYTYQHIGPWTQNADPSHGLFGAHISTLVLGLSTLTLPVDCLGDFGPRGLSGQYTQDGRGCPPAHTAHPWLSVCVHVCSSVSVSKHRTSVAVHQYTYQHIVHTGRLWESASTHSTFVAVRQHTQAVRGYPCVFVGVRQDTQDVRSCLWLSVSTHRTSVCVRQHTQDVCVCPCVPFRTHRTSVAVHQYTYQHAGPWTQHAVHSFGLFG